MFIQGGISTEGDFWGVFASVTCSFHSHSSTVLQSRHFKVAHTPEQEAVARNKISTPWMQTLTTGSTTG